ncbi:GmrSD restriction endonuclease domain-containing protein [Nesterenkonia alba]|uniref:GmrSD restriction endonuclease domain-containing protein n=1 Tax=Nesterenkonia alba TaxID=515814 RepID=UPI0003B2F04B|nr:DUF262 domain-containing protein [Nesterenkonia alba]
MGFQTPQENLSKYLEKTTSGKIQLPDFQRGYKWDDERIRQLLVTILRGHPMGVVMLLDTNNDEVRFKPRPVEGVTLPESVEPEQLLLDGQQRLTSMTQALTGDGVVATKDSRGKLLQRRYFVDIAKALEGEDSIDDAVISVDADGKIKTNFNRDVVLDLSTEELQQQQGYFPLSELYSDGGARWILGMENRELSMAFHERIFSPARQYSIPAIQLDRDTSKAAVATVFEKVNTGGLPLNVFELLTATFAGDKVHYEKYGTDFRLNDDWRATQELFAPYPVLHDLENTDFLQAVTLLTTLERQKNQEGTRRSAVSARREDMLKLTLSDYLRWVEPLREAFIWIAGFLADRHIFDTRFLPYRTQLIPLAVMKVLMQDNADLRGPRDRIIQWFWSGVLGELYGGTTATRFARDVQEVPDWAMQKPEAGIPSTIQEAAFAESRLHSLRTRNAAAYKGIYALLLANEARDWMEDKRLDKAQHAALEVDIHHIFPQKWCTDRDVPAEYRESIINKTAISAKTNRSIGGRAPSIYLPGIERKAQISSEVLDAVLDSHLISAEALRRDEFATFFTDRRRRLCELVENAMGKPVQRDIEYGTAQEDSAQFDDTDIAEAPDESVDAVGEVHEPISSAPNPSGE